MQAGALRHELRTAYISQQLHDSAEVATLHTLKHVKVQYTSPTISKCVADVRLAEELI